MVTWLARLRNPPLRVVGPEQNAQGSLQVHDGEHVGPDGAIEDIRDDLPVDATLLRKGVGTQSSIRHCLGELARYGLRNEGTSMRLHHRVWPFAVDDEAARLLGTSQSSRHGISVTEVHSGCAPDSRMLLV